MQFLISFHFNYHQIRTTVVSESLTNQIELSSYTKELTEYDAIIHDVEENIFFITTLL